MEWHCFVYQTTQAQLQILQYNSDTLTYLVLKKK